MQEVYSLIAWRKIQYKDVLVALKNYLSITIIQFIIGDVEHLMKEPIVLTSDDPILDTLNFKPYRNMVQRRVEIFSPRADEPQTKEITTPWGAVLTAQKGDFVISELDAPDDKWPVGAEIFDKSYMIIGPGLCVKRAITLLAPLTDLTGGDEDQKVTIHTLEGVDTVRAGDFLLAKGIKGEIWPYPKDKAAEIMSPVES